MVGAILRGVDHEGAAHFSFLIAFPIILAATVLELPRLTETPANRDVAVIAVLSSVVAGLVAFCSTALLMRYFRRNDGQALRPFALYCIAAGTATLGYSLLEGGL